MNNKKLRNDLILILVLLVLSLGIFLLVHFTRQSGNTAVVTCDGQVLARVSLDRDYENTFLIGDSYNTVIVRDGKVRVSEAGCPDKICVNSGWISYNGESIICLPNKFVVAVESQDNQFDTVAR